MTSEQNFSPQYTGDEYLQKVTLGERKAHNAPVTLVDYDPRWPGQFERRAQQVRDALGETALRVEHVGSTSVPGLCAKPVIDMVLVVPNWRMKRPTSRRWRPLASPCTSASRSGLSTGC